MTNNSNYQRVKEAYAAKVAAAHTAAKRREEEVLARFPELAAINTSLAGTGDKILALIAQGGDTSDKIASLQKENAMLLSQRKEILALGGYPSDYFQVKYQCETCSDSGFVVTFEGNKASTAMCACMRSALVIVGMDSSGLGSLLEQQTFDNFSLAYYSDTQENRENAARVLDTCRNFAKNFGKSPQNLLLVGGTGMGKTHLTTAVAGEVIRRGYDVVYQTAQGFMSDFENRQFGRGYGENSESDPCRRYTQCDLLILDDLGTEFTNQVTVSSLYEVVNARLISGRATIISTNLPPAELRTAYNDRISSRLLGEYTPLLLSGVDIRMQKLR